MSDVSNGTNGANDNADSNPKEEFVSKSAYEEVSKDMHKYKAQAKAEAAAKAELDARIKAIEESKLVEEKRFEELYQKEREAKEKAETALKSTNDHYIRSVKMTALMRELGNIKPKYLTHAALDEITVHDDGSLSSESVTKVANKFRQENPELVPTQNAGNINDAAPSNNTFTTMKTKGLEDLTHEEKRALLASKRTQSKRVGLRLNEE